MEKPILYKRLSELKTSEQGVITKVFGHGSFRNRITEMGFVRGKAVKVIKNAETPGIGDKVCANEEFHQQVADTIREGGEPDVIAGATKSSNGIIGGVRTAVSIYQTLEKEGALA